MKYFAGPPTDLGTVTALPFQTFTELRPWLEKPAVLRYTRAEYHALPSNKDRSQAKRVAYITPAAFATSPSPRKSEHVTRCYLIALDVDDSAEAARLLRQGWTGLMPFGFVVWHTASSTPENPRIRVIVSADGLAPQRYDAAVRTVAELLGLSDVTRESLVPVQPMFLPTVFADDRKNPIVAAHFDGDAFGAGDILDPEQMALPVDSAPTDAEVADIAYLQVPVEGVTIEDAQGALSHLDPDCSMQEWIEIAAGLKHQFQDKDAEALAVWDTWSQKGKKYVDSQETAYRWGTLKAQPVNRAPVTIRSVLRKATARGWTNTRLAEKAFTETLAWLSSGARSTEQLQDEGLKRIAQVGPLLRPLERTTLLENVRTTLKARKMPIAMQELKKVLRRLETEEARTTGIPPWAKNICYVTALDVFYRPSVDRRFPPKVLDLMHTAPMIGDEVQSASHYLAKTINVPQVENLRYEPAQGEKRYITIGGVPFVNTYRGCSIAPDQDRAEEAGHIFTQHLVNLVRDTKHVTTLMDYFAFMHQKPGVKIRWAPLIQSTKGAGKTFIAVALAATLGRQNVKKVDPAIVMDSKHNDWAYGAQIVVMEEVRIVGSNRHSVMDRLKPCISDDEICIRRMYEPPQTVTNVTNYMMFTNHHDSLAVQDDERRYFVLSSPLQNQQDVARLGGAPYFNKLFEMIRDNAGGLRAFFLNWRISESFNHEGRAPETEAFRELVETTASPLNAAIRQAIKDEGHALVRRDLISVSALRVMLQQMNLAPFSDQAICQVMRELGWSKGLRCSVGGDRHQLWTSVPREDAREMAIERLEVL